MKQYYVIMVKSKEGWRQHARQEIYSSIEDVKDACLRQKVRMQNNPEYVIGWCPIEIQYGGVVIV